MKSLRVVATVLMIVAGVASATAPAKNDAVNKGVILSEGSSPVPMCDIGWCDN